MPCFCYANNKLEYGFNILIGYIFITYYDYPTLHDSIYNLDL